MEVLITFFVAGIIIVTAFLSNALFRRAGLPEALILLGLEMALGPILHLATPEDILP